MNRARETLAMRRELLVTRAALQRLRATHDVLALREGLRWPLAGGAWASSVPVRLGILGLLMLAGRRRARLLRIAAVAMAAGMFVARLARPADRSPPTR